MRISVFGCLSLMAGLSMASSTIDSGDSSLRTIVKEFREKQVSERLTAQEEKDRFLSHLVKLKEMKAQLALPQDRRAIQAVEVEAAADRVAEARAEERLRAAERIVRGDFAGIPLRLHGQVNSGTDKSESPMNGMTPLFPGQSVHTALDSSIDLVFEDGCRIAVWPESFFELTQRTGTETDFSLRTGRIRLVYKPTPVNDIIGQVEVAILSTRLLLEANESQVWIDKNWAHVVLDSGDIHILARRMELFNFATPWWSEKTFPTEASSLIYGKWLRVNGIEGDSHIIREDGITRKVVVGAELAFSDRLMTGKGKIWATLDGGVQIAMNERTEIRHVPGTKLPFIMIDKGEVHAFVKRPKESEPAEFNAAQTHCRAGQAEFELLIEGKDRAEWIPLDGEFSLSARHPTKPTATPLELSK